MTVTSQPRVSPTRTTMTVRKRNGDTEPVDVNKIVRAVDRVAHDLADVDPMRVATRTISGLYDGATTAELDRLSIQTAADAQKAIFALDKAIANIDAQRADLGAVQNRFDSTIANLTAIMENTTASRGRIQDVDFASETAELTKQQTLQQASTAILAQANQLPSAVLKLLG